jgi:hypothetical protein
VPQVTDGGSIIQPIVGFHSITPVAGGGAGGGATQVTVQSGTVEQAVAAASKTVKAIPTAPLIANLPANAQPGEMYGFPSQPAVIYVYGFDNVWRALLLVAVV